MKRHGLCCQGWTVWGDDGVLFITIMTICSADVNIKRFGSKEDGLTHRTWQEGDPWKVFMEKLKFEQRPKGTKHLPGSQGQGGRIFSVEEIHMGLYLLWQIMTSLAAETIQFYLLFCRWGVWHGSHCAKIKVLAERISLGRLWRKCVLCLFLFKEMACISWPVAFFLRLQSQQWGMVSFSCCHLFGCLDSCDWIGPVWKILVT